jgi:polyphenol oxidase
MNLHKTPFFSIFFGDKNEQFIPADVKQISSQQLLIKQPFDQIKKAMSLEHLVFLHQVHGTSGTIIQAIDQVNAMSMFDQDGDFLITSMEGVGIGVATADCLPIILYDQINNVMSVVHAGWRGSLNGIAVKAFDQMQALFGSKAINMHVFFGPSAKLCCYEVRDDLISAFQHFKFNDSLFHTRDQKTFFDLPFFNQLLLQKKGIPQESFFLDYNTCTLCNEIYCSARRCYPTVYRQLTIGLLTRPS